jgi:hypothetical protein
VLALENEQGRVHRVSAGTFVDLLREADPMPRLVVLNACDSATSGQTDLFSGTAASLVRGGVSAVTAMQFEISDEAAIAFCRGFYTALGRGRSIDEAVRSGRVAILGLGEGSLEWITPTLYLRGQETHLFALSDSAAESPPATRPPSTKAPETLPPRTKPPEEPTRAYAAHPPQRSTGTGPLPVRQDPRPRPPPVLPAPPPRTGGGHRAPESPAPTDTPPAARTRPKAAAPRKPSADDVRKWRVKVALLLAGVLAVAAVVTVLVAVSSSHEPPASPGSSASTVLTWHESPPLVPGQKIDLDATADPTGTPDLKWNATEHQLVPAAARGLRRLCGFDPGERRPSPINDAPVMIDYMADEGFAIPDPHLGTAPVGVPENEVPDPPRCSFQPGGASGEGEPGWAVTVLVNTDQDAWSVVVAQRLDADNLKLTFVTYAL